MTDQPKSHGRKSISASTRPRDLMSGETLAGVWTARILTLFPEEFPGLLGASLTGKALKERLWQLQTTDLRSFGQGKHRNVDDTPTGGGAGMVLRPDVIDAALKSAPIPGPTLCLSPRGIPFTQAVARDLAHGPGVTLLCGRFEGIDQRVLDAHAITEVSIGDYVLTGGELAAQVLIDATVRLIPRVLGNPESVEEESFSHGLLEHPQYTRPTDWQGRTVPEVLLSGHHAEIAKWRKAQSERLTKERRPDLWRAYLETDGDPVEDAELSDAHTIAGKGENKD